MIEAAAGKVPSAQDPTEVCGIAPDGKGYLSATGAGAIVGPDGATLNDADRVWDNHMLRMETA